MKTAELVNFTKIKNLMYTILLKLRTIKKIIMNKLILVDI